MAFLSRAFCCFCRRPQSGGETIDHQGNTLSPSSISPDENFVLEKGTTPTRSINWQLDLSTVFVEPNEIAERTPRVPQVKLYQSESIDDLEMSGGTVDLERLVQRLEAATTRLEALSSQKPALAPKPGTGSAPSPHGGTQEAPPAVRQYDDAVEEPLQRFIKLSNQIGGDVKLMGEKVAAAFNEQRNFLWSAAGQKEVPAGELPAKLSPIVKQMEEISTLRESKRNTPQFNHLSAVSEGIQALGWVTVKPTPAPFIKDMYEAAMFFVNRVLKEHKDGDKVHTEWTKAWTDILNSLQAFVKQVHTTGLVWNSSPGACPPQSSGAATSSSGGPPPPPSGPPPPPPPPVLPPDLLSAKGDSGSDRAALFAEINKGEDITKGLRKVTADMQTHKNPSLRAQAGPIDTSKPSTAAAPAVPNKKETVKPPKTWLENGKQWNVEHHKNDQNIVLQITDMKQTIYVFKCENCVIQVKGKVNSITLDSCKKTSIVFDSLLSQIEVINCQGMQIQTMGAMPTLSIQKTDGCQVYLSKEALNAEIITSKSSSMNVLVPTQEEGDFVEFPVPEQFKTVFDGKKLTTTVSDIV